jgi:hypothetical protein
MTGNRNDPWANDQDWALVNLLMVRQIESAAKVTTAGAPQKSP